MIQFLEWQSEFHSHDAYMYFILHLYNVTIFKTLLTNLA